MSQSRLIKTCAFIWGISGVVILISVLYPIVNYEIEFGKRYENIVSPVVKEENLLTSEDFEYTKASNWFEGGAEKDDFVSDKVSFYTITIDNLEISSATVAIGGEDLSDSLIQYPGTALPGKIGNTVIFGHSILPQFYDPENYLAIFSLLPRLQENAEIRVNYDGILYRYIVESMFEVSPSDIQILEQNSNDSYLTLVTCTPPGHPLKPKRLIVRAKIKPTIDAPTEKDQANANISN